MYKLLGCYMFRHQLCHPQGACFFTLLNYMSIIAVLAAVYYNCASVCRFTNSKERTVHVLKS